MCAAVTVIAAPGASAATAPFSNPLAIKFQTDFKESNGADLIKTVPASIDVPRPIDADGNGTPDLVATVVAFSTSHVTLSVRRLGSPLPVKIEVLIPNPANSSQEIAVGYDGRSSTAPLNFDAHASIKTGSAIAINATVNVKKPGSSLAVVGSLFTPGANDARNNEKGAQVTYTPVPASAGIGLSLGDPTTSATISSPTATTAVFDVNLNSGSQAKVAHGSIALLGSVTVSLDQSQGASGPLQHVHYSATKSIASATVIIAQLDSSKAPALQQKVILNLTDLPRSIDFQQTDSGAVVDASGPIGNAEGGVANGEPTLLDPTVNPSYVYRSIDATGTIDSTSFQVAGVQHAEFDVTNGAVHTAATLQSAPIRVVYDDESQGTKYDAYIQNVPHKFDVTVNPSAARILQFSGQDVSGKPAGIDKVTLNASTTAPGKTLIASATNLTGEVDGIPADLRLDVSSDANKTVTFGATDSRGDAAPIGLVALTAWGRSDSLPSEPFGDNIQYVDTPDLFMVRVRLTGLSSAVVQTKPSLDLKLASEPGQSLTYSTDTQDSSSAPEAGVHGVVTGRPATIEVRIADTPDGSAKELSYTASGSAQEITLAGSNLISSDKIALISADLQGVPTGMQLFIPNVHPENITFTANAPIGHAYVELDNNAKYQGGTVNFGSNDGFEMDDLEPTINPADNVFVVRASITDLQKVVFSHVTGQDPNNRMDLLVNATGHRKTLAVIRQSTNEKELPVTQYKVTVDPLQPNTHFVYDQAGLAQGQTVHYTADQPANRLDFDLAKFSDPTQALPNVSLLHADIAPLDKNFYACQDSGDGCRDKTPWACQGCAPVDAFNGADNSVQVYGFNNAQGDAPFVVNVDNCSQLSYPSDRCFYNDTGDRSIVKGQIVSLGLSYFDVGEKYAKGPGFVYTNTTPTPSVTAAPLPLTGSLATFDFTNTAGGADVISVFFGIDNLQPGEAPDPFVSQHHYNQSQGSEPVVNLTEGVVNCGTGDHTTANVFLHNDAIPIGITGIFCVNSGGPYA